MVAQVVTTCDYLHGTLQHALSLARSLVPLMGEVRLVNARPGTIPDVGASARAWHLELVETSPDQIPEADLTLVVGLWDGPSRESAVQLVGRRGRLILVPTVYWNRNEDPIPGFRGRAEALWYVSWDQAADSIPHWRLAETVRVVPCAVDTERFHPSRETRPDGRRILCRHSRDAPEKFAPDVGAVVRRLGETYDLVFRMLGAVAVTGDVADRRIETYPQGSIDPATFLRDGDIWVYAHAPYWRETACIAMLEAMACGLPVLVTGAGGMREYLLHGRTGFACRDADEFARFLGLLLDRPCLLRRMSREARSFICRCHSLGQLTRHLRSAL